MARAKTMMKMWTTVAVTWELVNAIPATVKLGIVNVNFACGSMTCGTLKSALL